MIKDGDTIHIIKGECKDCLFNQLCDIVSEIFDKELIDALNKFIPPCDKGYIYKNKHKYEQNMCDQ